MEPVGIFEAKAKLTDLCEQVASRRESVVITRRGKPLVRIVPIEEGQGPSILERLTRYQETYALSESEPDAEFEPAARSRQLSRFQMDE